MVFWIPSELGAQEADKTRKADREEALVESWESLVSLREIVMKHLERDYGDGKITLTPVLEAQENLLEARLGLAKAKRDDEAFWELLQESLENHERTLNLTIRNYKAGDSTTSAADVTNCRAEVLEAKIRIQQAQIENGRQDSAEATKVPGSTLNLVGEVKKPGTFEWKANLSLFDALASAGGFTDEADKKQVKLVRGKQEWVYDLNTISEKPRPLQPGDRIVVGRRAR